MNNLKICTASSLSELPSEYKTDFEYRGMAIIANFHANQRKNEDSLKRGAEKDVEKLKRTFGQLQFQVKIVKSDQMTSKDKFLNHLKEVAKDGHHRKSESLVVVVMGLVRKRGMLHVCNEELQVDEVWEIFTNDKCISLSGKPKLFFFQAFWWKESSTLTDKDTVRGTHNIPAKQYSIPVESDIHIIYPAVEDAIAMEDKGSPFISCLCSVLNEDWFRREEDKEPLQCLMTYLCKRVDPYQDQTDGRCGILKQIPTVGSTLLRLMYFNQKFSSNDDEEDFMIEETDESAKTKDKEQREYKPNYEHRGKAIIANFYKTKCGDNIDKRVGSRVDVEKLKETFKKLQFNVEKENIWDEDEKMTADWFNEKLMDVAKDRDEYLKKSECFALVVMCHGGCDGQLFAFDKAFQVKDVWEKFTSQNCPSLEGKPKLFFFQACRGNKFSEECNICFDSATPIPAEQYWIPDEKDILIMYPTFQDSFSLRGMRGSPFVLSLCSVLEANFSEGGKEPVQILMTYVCKMVATKRWKAKEEGSKDDYDIVKQMPTVISTLQRLMYFRKKY